MKLLMDIGNRRLKWATADSAGLNRRRGVLGYADASDDADIRRGLSAQLADLGRPKSVWVSCVAGPHIRHAVMEYAHDVWSRSAIFVAAQKQQAGIVNSYPEPASLGSDRWAALVAARALCPQQPLIVVDAGTAVTVDLLDADGAFRGGVIFPGVYAMQVALGNQTANIDIADDITNDTTNDMTCADAATSAGPVNALATDTHGAVASGALLAVAGGINLAVAHQRAALPGHDGAQCKVLMTGGDAGRLGPLLDAEIRIEPHLVLQGLAVISSESAS